MSFGHRGGIPAEPAGVHLVDDSAEEAPSPVQTSSSALRSEPTGRRQLQSCSDPPTTPNPVNPFASGGNSVEYYIGETALSEAFDQAFAVPTNCISRLTTSANDATV